MADWFTAPAALAILAQGRPAVEWHERRYPRTTERWATFVGIEPLYALWSADFNATGELGPDPDDVLGALYGDANGNDQHRTHRDTSDEWAAIRLTLAPQLARAA